MDAQQSGLQEQLRLLKIHLDGIMDPDESQALIDTIENSGLPPDDITGLIADISNETGISAISATKLKVEAWRKTIVKLLLAGVTAAMIESYIPGIYYTLYEQLSVTITSLLKAGISAIDINSMSSVPMPSIPMPPMSSVPMPSIPNMAGMITSLTNGLKTGFFMAASIAVGCIGMVCAGGQEILNQLTIDNFNFTGRLATQLAIPAGTSYAYRVLRGDFDDDVVNLIDGGIIQQILTNISDKVSDVKQNIARTVAKNAINVNDMSLGVTWTDVAPDIDFDPDTNRIINNAIREQIEKIKANPDNTASITELLNDILIVLRADDKNSAIEVFKNKYKDINTTIPKLLVLLTAKPVKPRANFESLSQTDAVAIPRRQGTDLSRGSSLSSNLPVDSNNPFAVRNDYKAFPLGRPDVLRDTEILRRAGILPSRIKVAKITWNKDSDRFLYEFINVWLKNVDPKLVQKLNLLSAEDHNAIINRIREMGSSGGYNLLASLDNDNLDRSKEALYELFNRIYETIKVQMNTFVGGRRRIKSRHYKKRRSTLKRRRVKGRRTRKGKKRRSTKRRR
jgi:hypothetical protein